MTDSTPFATSLEGLSDDPILRAMQIAYAAIDAHLGSDAPEGEGMTEAYDALLAQINAREKALAAEG